MSKRLAIQLVLVHCTPAQREDPEFQGWMCYPESSLSVTTCRPQILKDWIGSPCACAGPRSAAPDPRGCSGEFWQGAGEVPARAGPQRGAALRGLRQAVLGGRAPCGRSRCTTCGGCASACCPRCSATVTPTPPLPRSMACSPLSPRCAGHPPYALPRTDVGRPAPCPAFHALLVHAEPLGMTRMRNSALPLPNICLLCGACIRRGEQELEDVALSLPNVCLLCGACFGRVSRSWRTCPCRWTCTA